MYCEFQHSPPPIPHIMDISQPIIIIIAAAAAAAATTTTTTT